MHGSSSRQLWRQKPGLLEDMWPALEPGTTICGALVLPQVASLPDTCNEHWLGSLRNGPHDQPRALKFSFTDARDPASGDNRVGSSITARRQGFKKKNNEEGGIRIVGIRSQRTGSKGTRRRSPHRKSYQGQLDFVLSE